MKKNVLILFALVAIVFSACESNSTDIVETTDEATELSSTLKTTDVTVSETAENAYEELSYEAEFFAESQHLLRLLTRSKGLKQVLKGYNCERYNKGVAPDISIDTADAGYPIVITIDYGDSTTVTNGRNISGIITVELSAADSVDGATKTITFTDCVVDTVLVNGEMVRTYNGDDSTKVVTGTSDVIFWINDTTEYHRTSEQVREWLSGLDTPMEHSDDEMEVTGTSTITNYEGIAWERLIVEPLLKIADCRNYVQGTIEIYQDEVLVATLDYGDGECDNLATLTTADGEVTEIELNAGKALKQGNNGKGNNKNNGSGNGNNGNNGGK